MNQWDELTDANIPDAWLTTCQGMPFSDDCKCSFFRGAHGSVIRNNIFARVTQHKNSPFFSDGLVYVSGPGYVQQEADVTIFEDNTYLASPWEGAPSMRMLYIDGFTGSMRISRNAVVDGNTLQGFNLCNWYGQSPVSANVLELGDAFWGGDFVLGCDGSPVDSSIMTMQGNLVLSDESSGIHQPDVGLIDDYLKVYETVCTASLRAGAPSDDFLDRLNNVITQLGGQSRICDGAQRSVLV
jgi:hypothetical protein